jgi:uncharacterized protein YpuA (DUF1002 family)
VAKTEAQMDKETAESFLAVQKTLNETIASIKAIRSVLYQKGLTTPQELKTLQDEVRELLKTSLAGTQLQSLEELLSGTDER